MDASILPSHALLDLAPFYDDEEDEEPEAGAPAVLGGRFGGRGKV